MNFTQHANKITLAFFLFCMGFMSNTIFAQAPNLLIKATSSSNNFSIAHGTAVDALGNTYITGYFSGSVAFGSTTLVSAGGNDIFLAKYNNTGTFQWAKRAGGTSGDIAYGVAVSGNDVYITGYIESTANFNTPSATGSNTITSAGNQDIFLAKYDNTGSFQWAKRAGSTTTDIANSVAVSGNNVYITGYFTNTANFNTPSATGSNTITAPFNIDIFLAKYDNTGSFQWAKRAGGTGDSRANGVAVSGNDVYITGYIIGTANFNTPSASGSNEITSAGETDIFLAKYDNTGSFKWAKRAGSEQTGADQSYGVAVSGSDVYITGSFNGTANFNTPSATTSNTITSAGSYDIFLAKYNNIGSFQWAKRAGGINFEEAYGVAVSGNDVYITGYFNNTANFNTPSASGSNEITPAGFDIFLARYDITGSFKWAKRAGGTNTDKANSVAVSGSDVYITGFFVGTANFNTPYATGSNELTTTATNGAAFWARYKSCNPPITYTLTGTGTYCANQNNIAVNLSNSEIGVTYQLKKGSINEGNAVNGTGLAISFGVQTAGTYTVVATKTDGGCTATMTGSAIITINSLPIVNITASNNCGNTVLSATSGMSSYLWSNTATTANITVSSAATYKVTVTNNGCSASANADVTILYCYPKLSAKVFLGHVNSTTQLMDNALAALATFPLNDPYANVPFNTKFNHVNAGTAATLNPALLSATGANAIVDWVFLELRTGTSGATSVAYTKAALLKSNGDIINPDGTSPVVFNNAPLGSYYLTIRHRNHLGFRTNSLINFSNSTINLNFTNNSVLLYGITPLISITPTIFAMVSGDANFDGSIDAFDNIDWEAQNGLFDNYIYNADYNLDGSIDAFDNILWELNNGKFEELD